MIKKKMGQIFTVWFFSIFPFFFKYCVKGIVAGVLDCDIVVSELELQSYYYVHFWTHTLGINMKFLIPLPTAMDYYYCPSTRMALA